MTTTFKVFVAFLAAVYSGAIIYAAVHLNIEPAWICLGVILLPLGAILISKFPALLIAGLLFVGGYKSQAGGEVISLTDPTLILVLLASAAIGWELLLIVGGVSKRSLRDLFRSGAHGVAAFLVLLVVVAVSYLHTPVPTFGMDKLIQFAVFDTLAFFAPFFLIRNEREFRTFMYAIVVLAIPMAIKLIMGISNPTGAQLLGEDDVTQIGVAALVDIAILTLLYYRVPLRFNRFSALTLVSFLAVASVASFARGPNLMLLVVVIISTFLLPSRSTVSRFKVIAAVLALVIVMFVSLMWVRQLPGAERRGPQKAAELSALAHGILNAGGTTSERLTFFKSSVTAFTEHPFTGVGLAAWPTYFGDIKIPYPHNFVLEVAAEQGMPGLIALFWLLGSALVSLLHVRRSKSEFVFMLPVFLFACLFNSISSGVVNRITFTCIGLAFVAARMLPARTVEEFPSEPASFGRVICPASKVT
jgi:O-antigen ligase